MSQRRRGAVLSYAQIFVNIAIALAFTPFLISSLGRAEYGVFSIVGSFAAYLFVLDMGMNDSVVRHIVGFRARGDESGAHAYFTLMLMAYLALAAVVVGAGTIVYHRLPEWFAQGLTGAEIALLRQMFLIVLVNTALTVALNPVGALLVASERFVFLRVIEMASHLLSVGIICLYLLYGYGALTVVAVTAAVNVAVLIYKVWYVFRRLKTRLRFRGFSSAWLAGTLTYSLPIFAVVIVEQIYWKLDNIIIGALVGSGTVAVYAVGVMFNKYFMSFSTAISKVMLPDIIRRIDLGADGRQLTDLLVRIARMQALVLLLVLSGLFLFGDEFIVLWLGSSFEPAYYVMLLTLGPYTLELVGNVRNVILQVKGLYWYRSAVLLVIALLNIPLTVVLLQRIGVIGAAASTGAGIVLGYTAVNVVLQKKARIEIRRFLVELAEGIAPAAGLCLLIGLALDRVTAASWGALVLNTVVFSAVYGLAMWRIGMNANERSSIRRLLRRSNDAVAT